MRINTPHEEKPHKTCQQNTSKSIDQHIQTMYHKQVVFTPGMQGQINILKPMNVIHYLQSEEDEPQGHINGCRKSKNNNSNC